MTYDGESRDAWHAADPWLAATPIIVHVVSVPSYVTYYRPIAISRLRQICYGSGADYREHIRVTDRPTDGRTESGGGGVY